jgi:hypothetical protein
VPLAKGGAIMPTVKGLKIQTNLSTVTRKLLRNRPRTLTITKITEDTGLNRRFVDQFSTGVAKMPDVDKIEALYVYLSKKPLILEN